MDPITSQPIASTPIPPVKTSNMGKIILGILGVLVFGAACAYAGYKINTSLTKPGDANTNATTTPTTTATTTATATPSSASDPYASWKTYTNSQDGFSFKYPTDFSVTSASALTIQPELLGDAVVSVENPTGQYALSNYKQFSIFTVDSTTNTSSCYVNQGDGTTMTSTTTVNGTIFKYADTTNGAAGTETESRLYRVVKGQTCFEINSLLGVSTDNTNIDTDKENTSKAAANAELAQIFSTFMFN